jgi:putative flippase GtrA
MPPARLLPERWQKFVHEALKFGIVGGINTVINYAVFNALALTVFRDGQLKATVVATLVATVTSYLMNRHWTYRDRPGSALKREYALFFLFNGAGLLIELGVLAVAKYGLGVTSLLMLNVAKTGGVLLATLFRFWSYRTFVFQPAPQHAKETWHDVPRDEWDNVAELDPVAELAESVNDLEEAEPQPGERSGQARKEGRRIIDRGADYAPPQGRPAAADAGFGATLDADLAAELQPTPRRSPRR